MDNETDKLANQVMITEIHLRRAIKTVERFIKTDPKTMGPAEILQYIRALSVLQKYANTGKV